MEQVKALLAQLDDKKENLRRLLPQLEDSHPQFVSALKSAMVIVNTAATHSSPKTPASGGAKSGEAAS